MGTKRSGTFRWIAIAVRTQGAASSYVFDFRETFVISAAALLPSEWIAYNWDGYASPHRGIPAQQFWIFHCGNPSLYWREACQTNVEKWSERQDSNLRRLAPKASALARLSYAPDRGGN